MYAKEITEEHSANPENTDAEANFHPESHAAVARDDKCTHRKPAYISTIEIDM